MKTKNQRLIDSTTDILGVIAYLLALMAIISMAYIYIGCDGDTDCPDGYHESADGNRCIMDTPTCDPTSELVFTAAGDPLCCLPGQEADPDGNCRNPEPHPYTVCAVNADPVGIEKIPIKGWIITAAADDGPVYIRQHQDEGCYYATGPTLTAQAESFDIHGTHPCFGEYTERITLVRGIRAISSYYRNDIPCTPEYEADCRRMDDPDVIAALENHDPTLTASVQGCCDFYAQSQTVCEICPLFPIETCAGNGVEIFGDICQCAVY